MRIFSTSTLIACSCLLILAGCGGSTAEVHGRVTMGDTPIKDAIVYFVPASGPQAQGRLSDDGSYSLTTPGKGKWAAPGKYHVYLAATVSDQDENAKENLSSEEYRAGKLPKVAKPRPSATLPAKVLSLGTTPLKCEVKAGDNEIDFDLAKL
jgi:hypothetical protein